MRAGDNPLSPRMVLRDAARAGAYLAGRDSADSHLRDIAVDWVSPGGTILEVWDLLCRRDDPDEPIAEGGEPPWTNARIDARIDAIDRALRRPPEPGEPPVWIDAADPGTPGPLVLPPTLARLSTGELFPPTCATCGGEFSAIRDDARLAARGLPGYATSAIRFVGCRSCLSTSLATPLYCATPRPEWKDVRGPEALLSDQAILRATGGETPSAADLAILTLGGGPVLVRRRPTRTLPAAARALATTRTAETRDGAALLSGRLFAADGGGLDALEVLRLKLKLFRDALADVHAWHRANVGPHLALSPDAFGVWTAPPSAGSAAWWAATVRLVGVPGAFPVANAPAPGAYLPRPTGQPIYLPDLVRDGRYWTTRAASLTVDEATPGPILARATLRDPGTPWPPLSAKDLARLRVPGPPGTPALDLWARIDPARATADGVGLLLLGDADARDALAQSVGVNRPGTAYALFPALGPPVDLFAMGMTLLVLLVAHDEQPPAAIATAIAEGRRVLEGGDPGATRRLAAQAAAWLGSGRSADVFHRRHLFADAADRRAGRPSAIPAGTWQATLLLGLRMILWVPGFGLCADHGDFDANYPAGVFEPPLAEIETLLARIDAVLLGDATRHREARHAIRAFARRGAAYVREP
jgi:hypothetical protein